MAYTTIPFLIFTVITALVYFAFSGKKYQWTVLLAASYFFYLWANWRFVAFILVTTATIYFSALQMQKIGASGKETVALHKKEWDREQKKQYKETIKKKRRRILVFALVLNFGILAFLKYFNFFAGSLNGLFGMFGRPDMIPALKLFLPLGISFYTFQSTGYVIDVYREKIDAEKNFGKFALFVSFFPQIIQGPISFYDQLAAQLYAPHRFDYKNLKYGMELIIWGYFKKMVIADRAVALINTVTADYQAYNGTVILLTVLTYALQLYADFSGGIDISRGFAEILGIHMVDNFKRPYFSVNINDYWRRWHITLGAWMKNYVFYSLAMSKKFLQMGKNMKNRIGKTAAGAHVAKVFPTCLASLITFLIVGIWHGSNWKYVAFGVWNGGVIMISILLQPAFQKLNEKLHINPKGMGMHIFRIFRTFLIVLVGYMFDIGQDFLSAMDMIARCFYDFSVNGMEIAQQLKVCGLDFKDYTLIILCAVLIFFVSLCQERHPDKTMRVILEEKCGRRQWTILMIGLLAILIFGVYGPGCNAADFVYMQF